LEAALPSCFAAALKVSVAFWGSLLATAARASLTAVFTVVRTVVLRARRFRA
jgi:hypothetical protein